MAAVLGMLGSASYSALTAVGNVLARDHYEVHGRQPMNILRQGEDKGRLLATIPDPCGVVPLLDCIPGDDDPGADDRPIYDHKKKKVSSPSTPRKTSPHQNEYDVSQPIMTLLRWVTWGVFGVCVAGVLIVATRMAIRHRSGEFGAHATGLVWVGIATIVAASVSAVVGTVLP
ncbi:hypothetical protein E1293_20695 [Actinomadura darangshiensis]|uniref:Uncharacterized protein n=1 Tax=Actinomadura darangshiensis TaxID=705336 RepID=A0A4R5B603_9ACTN|nr:hypothetical protein [Actinomadura darangshiensis]TDD80433.1 hypothetical protein E1293_20695 [Actinomadura darangshiensis]